MSSPLGATQSGDQGSQSSAVQRATRIVVASLFACSMSLAACSDEETTETSPTALSTSVDTATPDAGIPDAAAASEGERRDPAKPEAPQEVDGPGADAGATIKCDGEIVESESDCLMDDALCFELPDGRWCTAARPATCPPGSRQIAMDAPCRAGHLCFQQSEGVRCETE